ncbi:hypothetical protein GCM10022258_41120 [Aquimarina gracilis]
MKSFSTDDIKAIINDLKTRSYGIEKYCIMFRKKENLNNSSHITIIKVSHNQNTNLYEKRN